MWVIVYSTTRSEGFETAYVFVCVRVSYSENVKTQKGKKTYYGIKRGRRLRVEWDGI